MTKYQTQFRRRSREASRRLSGAFWEKVWPVSTRADNVITDEAELVAKIRASESRSDVVETVLETDEQVIARVTDGIYRQPASALRELISNAYDADASRVVIKTDPTKVQSYNH